MDWILVFLGVVLLIAGLFGALLPILPGPPLSFIGLVVLQLSKQVQFTMAFLVSAGVVAFLITLLDYYIPAWFTKKMKSSPQATKGAVIGTVLGLFILPPFGIVVLPVVGAFAGELMAGSSVKKASASALAGLMGIVSGMVLKGIYGLWALIAGVYRLF